MRRAVNVRVGPVTFRIGSDWAAPVAAVADLYRDYPPAAPVPDLTVRLEAPRQWRRWLRPQVAVTGDFGLPGMVPLPLAHGLLAAEMGMNLQMALGHRRHLLLHAASVERDGAALVMTGESGAGKSTLSALLAARGWRFMGDEFALLAPDTGLVHAFPRPVSLKNESIAAVQWDGARAGPVLTNTPKGTIRHLAPDAAALAASDRPARAALLLFPRFGQPPSVRPVPPGEAFARLTQASTNYVALGEAGFRALVRLVRAVPAVAVDYPDTESGIAAVEALWAG